MKRILKIAAFAFVMVLGSSLRNTVSAQYDQPDQYNNDNDVSYQKFYDELSPYGQWVEYPEYGYVWVPDAGSDFRPYSTNGHWVYTDDYEWMWVSDYDWGWAPFHYGRWEEDDNYGWFWVPGYEWSPAWVAWRDGGDYYGWAPLRPGISISINFGSYNPPNDYWCFVPRRYISSPRIYDYYVDRRTNINIISYTTIINYNNYNSSYGFRSGPRRYDAERYCGRINPVRFSASYTPGRSSFRNNEVSIYRPNVRRDAGRNVAPRQFERYDRNNAGSFRDRNNNNGNVRRNDNTTGRNDNGFNRNGNNGGVDRRDRTGNNDQPFRRNDNTVRQPQTDGNGNNDRRRIDRPNTPSTDRNGQGGNGSNDRRFDPRNNNNGNNDGFPRRDDQRVGGQPDRQPTVEPRRVEQPRQFERRNDQVRPDRQPMPSQEQPRQFERRNDQVVQPRQEQPRQFERRNDQVVQPRQEQPRQFERRNDQVVQPRQEQPRQFERKNDQVVQPRQEQPRSAEKRDNSNDGNRGGGRGRGRN